MGARLVIEGTLRRRDFLGWVTLLLAGAVRRVRAQGAALLRYRPLARPVLIPLADISSPGRARQFVADAVTLSSAATPNQPIRVTGMIVRTAAGENRPELFRAVCVRCPHEGCDVDFVADPGRLPTEVIAEIGRPIEDRFTSVRATTARSGPTTARGSPDPRPAGSTASA